MQKTIRREIGILIFDEDKEDEKGESRWSHRLNTDKKINKLHRSSQVLPETLLRWKRQNMVGWIYGRIDS